MKVDWGVIWTIIGVGITTIFSICGVIYTFVRNFKTDIKSDMKTRDKLLWQLDNRIFQLAMGKTFKEILIEEKKAEEEKKGA